MNDEKRKELIERLAEVIQLLKEEEEALEQLLEEIPEEEKPPFEPDMPEVRLEDVRPVLVELSRAGKTAEVQFLIKQRGCEKLSDVAPEDFAGLLEEARRLLNGTK